MNRVESKAELRTWAKTLAPATGDESRAVAEHVSTFIAANRWRSILTFLAMPGEVDLATIKGDLELAVTRTPARGPLTIHRLDENLETHPFGYRQPREGAAPINPEEIECVLVPGVLFAADGSRLGHGRGYYDTLLHRLTHRPFLLGVTLARRVIAEVPMTDADVYMNAVATENGVTLTSSSTR